MYVLLFWLKPTNPKDDVGDYRSLVSSLKLSDGAVRSGEELSKVNIGSCSNPPFFTYICSNFQFLPIFTHSEFELFCSIFLFIPFLSNIPIQLFCSNLELCLRYFALILIIGRGWPGPACCLKDWRSRWEACSIDEQLNNLLMFNRMIGSDFWKATCPLTRTWWIADWRDGQKSIIINPPDNKLTRERTLVNYQTMSRTSIWQIAGSTNNTVEVQLYIKS